MRKFILLSFVVLLVASVASAQESAVSGRLVNASGVGLDGVAVELVAAEGGQPVGNALQTVRTGARGVWAFSGVPIGEWVVRAVIDGSTVGIPVTVGAAPVAGVVLAAPSAVGAAAGAAAAGGGLSAAALAGIAGAAAVATIGMWRDDLS